MGTIVLVRHAAHDDLGRILSGRSDVALNSRGAEQADRLARRLLADRPVEIHASPRRRTRQTAQAIASHAQMEVKIMDNLDEIDFGAWTGASFAQLASDPRWDAWNARRSTASAPEGESMASAVARAVEHCERHRGDTDEAILCVTHGDIIRGTVAHYLGLSLDGIHGFDVEPASITRLRLTRQNTCLLTMNEVPS